MFVCMYVRTYVCAKCFFENEKKLFLSLIYQCISNVKIYTYVYIHIYRYIPQTSNQNNKSNEQSSDINQTQYLYHQTDTIDVLGLLFVLFFFFPFCFCFYFCFFFYYHFVTCLKTIILYLGFINWHKVAFMAKNMSKYNENDWKLSFVLLFKWILP